MRAMTIYRPNTIQNALSDFDRCFESILGDSMLTPANRIPRLPAVDVREIESSYILEMELPGYDEKDIKVNIDGNRLYIESVQHEAQEEKKNEGTYIFRERRVNGFSRSFKLPEDADSDAVTASFKNGVLELEIKKRPEAQKRTIQINGK